MLREPARVLEVGFESDDLVNHIVKSAADQPGALPLLADLFTDLWGRMRERGDATLRVYDRREIIQVGAALSRRAEKFLAENPSKVEATKRLFTLRLAHVPRQGEPVRARWQRNKNPGADLAADAEWGLVEQLAGPDWRLTVTGEKDGKATAEIAHEILLETWPTLRHWLEEEREFLIWRGELDGRRKDYEEAGKAGSSQQRQALLTGLALGTAKKWLAARQSDIEAADRAFIGASVQADRAAARNRQGLWAALGVLMLGVIVGLIAWINQSFIEAQWTWYWTDRPFLAANVWPYVLGPADEAALKPDPNKSFRECTPRQQGTDYCPDMIVIRAGPFLMGSPASEPGQHTVAIAKPLAVSKYELTFAEWDTCATYGECAKGIIDNGFGRGQRPVINVSWDDAQTYVRWLSKMTGKTYRLLSEAEYEYATRAGTTTAYPWASDDPNSLVGRANCDGCGGKWGNKQTAPVGQFPANEFGLYDMVGNVWEWVEDCYHENFKGSPPTDGSAWGNDKDKCLPGFYVTRGGGWNNAFDSIRSDIRSREIREERRSFVGFRIVRDLGP